MFVVEILHFATQTQQCLQTSKVKEGWPVPSLRRQKMCLSSTDPPVARRKHGPKLFATCSQTMSYMVSMNSRHAFENSRHLARLSLSPLQQDVSSLLNPTSIATTHHRNNRHHHHHHQTPSLLLNPSPAPSPLHLSFPNLPPFFLRRRATFECD